MSESRVCRYCGGMVQEYLTVSLNGHLLCSVRCRGDAVQRLNRAKGMVLRFREVPEPSPVWQRRYDKACEVLAWFSEALPESLDDVNTSVVTARVGEYERARWRGYILP